MKKSFLLVMALGLFLGVGCQKKDDEDTPVAPPPAKGDQNAGFTLTHHLVKEGDDTDETYAWKQQYLRFKLHKNTTDFDVPCTAEVGEDVTCIMEADEEDLYYFGTAFKYNVPPDMCNFIHHRPYLYYGESAGAGPTAIQVDTVGAAVGSDFNSDGDLADPGESADPTKCQHDHSPDGPNCCVGEYARVNRTWNGASYDITSTTTGNKWGGTLEACVDGPAKYIPTWPKNTKGFPLTLIKWVYGIGDSTFHQIYPPLFSSSGGPRGNNVFAASWFDIADHGGGFPSALITYVDGSRSNGDQITCRDRDSEVISRMTLYIRDWNTQDAWDSMVDNPNDHSLTGTEDAPFTSYDLNDFEDWGDIGNGYPGLPTP